VAGGKVEPFDGDLDEYAAWLRSRPGSDNPKTPAPKAQPAIAPAPAKPAAKVNPHKVQKAEALVAELEAKLAGIDRQLADPKVYVDATRVADLGREQAALRSRLEAAEGDLLALYD
jgi:ATP-binding cassette subfamily F protein 3